MQTPGEKYDLSSIARYHPALSEIIEDIDIERAMFWSGQLHGKPEMLQNIISTHKYDLVPENVMPVTGGTSMCIFLACTALLKPGDEVICERPGWPQVGRICERKGININWWHLRPENNWKPDLDELKDLITPKTKLIYINHPHNPTGSGISNEEMSDLCNVATKHGIYIVSDEINRGLEWESDELTPSVVNFYERGFAASSLSKRFGATGIRFGWFATRDRKLYDECYNIYYNSQLCNNHPSEIIAGKLLEPERYRKLIRESRETGKENLKALSMMIEKNNLWDWVFPSGSYSCFLKYDTGEPSWDFFERMLTRKPIGLELVPGSCFDESCEFHIRVGFGGRPAYFKKAIELLEEGANEYNGQKR
jgi:aspartate/methionine/tyrosine aminotransferase